MAYANCSTKLSMKVVINKLKSKVIFAEASSHVVDILLRFLTLPLGKIVRILENHYGREAPVLGCLTTLYRDLFNRANFSAGDANRLLFMGSIPLEFDCRKLVHAITNSNHPTPYLCQSSNCPFSGVPNTNIFSELGICVCCEEPLLDANGGNFTVVSTSFIICDDLRFAPNVSGFSHTLNSLGITDIQGAEVMSFKFGIDDVMDLLKFSLISSTPLTDLVFKNRSETNHGPGISLSHADKGDNYTDKKMILKVSLQKSTNRFLFAEASDDFVECVFGFLSVPLGGVEYLFGGKTCLQSVDNLYRSARDGVGDEFFMSVDIKNRLINPNIGNGYFSANSGKCDDVKRQNIFVVSDDLRVIPFSVDYIISTLNRLGIALLDVKEMEVHVGREEALSILKASLTSKACLRDALIKPILNTPSTVKAVAVKAKADAAAMAKSLELGQSKRLVMKERSLRNRSFRKKKISILKSFLNDEDYDSDY